MKRALAALLALAAAAAGSAEPPTATASLQPDRLAAGQTTIYRISIAGNSRVKSAPALPLNNLEVAAGPSIENRFEWINGRTSSQTVFVWELRALRAGAAGVGPVRFTDASGSSFQTNPVAAFVESSSAPTAPPAAISGDPGLVSRLDPPSPYVGQQAIWTLFLLTRGSATRGEVRALPDFKGFWSEDLEHESNVSPTEWNLRGEIWHAYPMARKALFPSRAGRSTIAEARATIAIRSDFFDVFGESPFGDSRTVERRSEPLNVVVRPLPPGAGSIPVGNFSMKASLDRPEVPEGGAATLTAVLSGDGRLSEIGAPSFSVEGARVSDPDSRLVLKRGTSRLTAVRTWQWVIAPEKGGTLSISPLSVAFFNPALQRVAEASTPGLALRAAAVKSSAPAPAAPPRAESKRIVAPASGLGGLPPLPVAAGAVLLSIGLLAAGYGLGSRRGRTATAGRSNEAGNTEHRIERLLADLIEVSAKRGPAAAEEVGRLREEFTSILFAPELSSRSEALASLEAEAGKLARRMGIR